MIAIATHEIEIISEWYDEMYQIGDDVFRKVLCTYWTPTTSKDQLVGIAKRIQTNQEEENIRKPPKIQKIGYN